MFLCIELLLSMGTRVTIGSSNVTTDNSSQSRALSFLGTANIQQFLRDYWKMILLSCYYSIWLLQKAREVGLSPEPDVTIFGKITLQFAGKIWWEPSTFAMLFPWAHDGVSVSPKARIQSWLHRHGWASNIQVGLWDLVAGKGAIWKHDGNVFKV